MLKRERQVYILHQVNLHNKVLSADLSLAWALPPSMSATFISGSILAIFEYTNHPNINVIVSGDKISKNSKITIGPEAVARIRQLKADVCESAKIDTLVTELSPDDPLLKPYKNAGIQVL